MTKTLAIFAEQVTSVAKTVGVEGKLGAQAEVPNVAGTWKDLTDNVNLLANNLTAQVRNIAEVTTAVARGDLSKKISVDAKGEILAVQEHHEHDGGSAAVVRSRKLPASPAKSAPTENSAARRKSRASRASGRI